MKNSWLKLKPGKMEMMLLGKKEVIQEFSKRMLMVSSPSHREKNTSPMDWGCTYSLRLNLF